MNDKNREPQIGDTYKSSKTGILWKVLKKEGEHDFMCECLTNNDYWLLEEKYCWPASFLKKECRLISESGPQTPDHYQGLQPYDVMSAWYPDPLPIKEAHLIGDIIKRMARLDRKGQRGQDLDKIIHHAQMLKELGD